jgi:hypothetical protein
MNPLHVDFSELYRRHLCRHSQWGVNANHLVAVIGTYFAIMNLVVGWSSWWLLLVLVSLYLAIIATSVPWRVLAAVALTLIGLMAATYLAPPIPWWTCVIIIVASYFFQQAGHRVYTKETDMSDFQRKYPKGLPLFLLLSIYELPILLNYLLTGAPVHRTASLP